MTRREPETGHRNPALVEAFYAALQESSSPVTSTEKRQGQYGKRWVLTHRSTLTTTEGSYYLYVENPDPDRSLSVESVDVYTDGQVTADVHDEPVVSTSNWTQKTFKNTRSSVTKNPPWSAFEGKADTVSVDDMGRLFSLHTVDSGNDKRLGKSSAVPVYIVDPESSFLIEISNVSSNDCEITVNATFHEQVSGPDMTTMDATNQ